ncbi:hypothetical protein CYY_003732 [Polysphondylium violaceum]|uniref:CMP/dCMP-type deaminase domain-containing protein n=1 Tax=Polysphondylium violaceum TaxID=133409 RepID=A0A8J4PWI2_9MYCE|nr:hypothetical protein CYY_003732 [Polysphondylium violaceum]
MSDLFTCKTIEELDENEKKDYEKHCTFMRAAIEEGEKAFIEGEVPVACVIVHNDTIISRGSNKTNIKKNGTRHAELEAFDQIFLNKELNEKFKDVLLQECTLYVTVEPCLMCAAALQLVKIKKVYFGCFNEKFGGNGSVVPLNKSELSNGRPYSSISGLLKNEAIFLLQKFYNQENKKAPVPNKRKRLDPEELLKLAPTPFLSTNLTTSSTTTATKSTKTITTTPTTTTSTLTKSTKTTTMTTTINSMNSEIDSEKQEITQIQLEEQTKSIHCDTSR